MVSLAALASADVKHLNEESYHYPKPSNDGFVAHQTTQSGFGHANIAQPQVQHQQIHSVPLTQNTGFGSISTPSHSVNTNTHTTGGSFSNGGASFTNGGLSNTGFINGGSHHSGSSGLTASRFDDHSGSNVNVNYHTTLVRQTAPLVSKSSYVFSAPEDEETFAHDQTIILPRPKQHYKVVFIKAPSTTVVNSPSAAAGGLTQEKTLIYVLSDKKRIDNVLDVPELDQSKLQKPEVFFINRNAGSHVVNSKIKYETVDAVQGSEYGSIDGIPNVVRGNGEFHDEVSTPEQNQIAQGIYQALQTGGLDNGVRTVEQLIAGGHSIGVGSNYGTSASYDNTQYVQRPSESYETTQQFVVRPSQVVSTETEKGYTY